MMCWESNKEGLLLWNYTVLYEISPSDPSMIHVCYNLEPATFFRHSTIWIFHQRWVFSLQIA